MRITDLSIILHRWDVPPTTYRESFGGGSTDVGVVTIHTDEGVQGHAFLGRASAPAYASSAVMSRVEDYVDQAHGFREAGWTAYKIHPPCQPRVDVQVCQAVKDAVGDSMALMLDSMWSYGYEDAVRVGRAIQ